MIKKFYRSLRYKLVSISWKKDIRIIKNHILESGTRPKMLDLQKKVLILAPHSDDEWIGCFSLIENFDCVICSMDMIGDNDNKTRALRFKEMQKIANRYNRELIKVGDNKLDSLSKIIDRANPSYIAVPFFIDWHNEHIDTINILKNALFDYDGDIICYQVSCPIPISYVTDVYPLSKKAWKRKWQLFRDNYRTQKFFPWKRFAAIERAEGGFANEYAANVFSIFNVKDWKNAFNLIPSPNMTIKIKSYLNSPKELFLFLNNNE